MNFNRRLKIVAPLTLVFVLVLGGFVWLRSNKTIDFRISADAPYFVPEGGSSPAPTGAGAPTVNSVNTCGMDITLVMDMTGSMTDGERVIMKTALKNLVDSFASTPTQFALVTFGNFASTVLEFSPSTTPELIKNSIDAATVPEEDGTNWDDALYNAKDTFDSVNNRSAKRDLIIFASDGQPNYYDEITQVDDLISVAIVSDPGGTTAVQHAAEMADEIQAENIKILGLAISADANIDNFKQVIGNSVSPDPDPITLSTDIISSDFDNLGTNLTTLYSSMCNDAIVVQAQIDTDGDGDADIDGGIENALLTGYGFDLSGPSSITGQTTTTTGLFQYTELDVGSYSITETPKTGYTLESAECQQNGSSVGNFNLITNTISNIPITLSSNAYCVFINKATTPQIGITVTASPTGVPIGGGLVVFTYTIVNPSNTELEQVNVTDTQCSPVTYKSGDTNSDSKLQNSETWRYTCQRQVTSSMTSNATVTGYYNNQTVTAFGNASVSAAGNASVSVIPAGPPKTGR